QVPRIKFYRFPWRPYESEKRERWIQAVRRASPDGKPWQPVRHETRICSAHFVGNEKSSIASHPAYVPTIFPPSYGKDDGMMPSEKLQRYLRSQRRAADRTTADSSDDDAEESASPLHEQEWSPDPEYESPLLFIEDAQIPMEEGSTLRTSVLTQTDGQSCQGACTILLSMTSGCIASTQPPAKTREVVCFLDTAPFMKERMHLWNFVV
ncbi:hypothetical protein V5799_019871, partial [Amblyomma americanum]